MFNLTVNYPNLPPVVTSVAQRIQLEENAAGVYSYPFKVLDAENDIITFIECGSSIAQVKKNDLTCEPIKTDGTITNISK